MESRISLFIPAFNAADTLGAVIDRIPADLWQATLAIWIIDDGSTDATAAVADALAAKHRVIHPVRLGRNKGYGTAVRHGLWLCKDDGCDYAACVHADGQYPPEEVLPFAKAMAEQGVDLMQGSRLASGTALSGGMPFYKYIAGRTLTAMENRVFGLAMTDFHSGFLLYSRRALETLPFHRLSDSFDFDLEVIASARGAGLTVAERPIPTRYAGERSYLNPVTYGLRVVWVMVKYAAGWYGKGDRRKCT